MMQNVAVCYVQLEMYEEAISWFKKVFQLYEAELGADHDKTISALTYVAHQCFNCKKFDEAIGHYHRILTTNERKSPDSDEKVSHIIY